MMRSPRTRSVIKGVVGLGIVLSMLLAGAAPIDFSNRLVQLAPAATP